MVPARPLFRMDPNYNSLSRQPPRLLYNRIINRNRIVPLLRPGAACPRHPARNQAEHFEHFIRILAYFRAPTNHHPFERMVGFAAFDHNRGVWIAPQIDDLLRLGKASHHDITIIDRVCHRDQMWIAIAIDGSK
jgi:hypothetical protein